MFDILKIVFCLMGREKREQIHTVQAYEGNIHVISVVSAGMKVIQLYV